MTSDSCFINNAAMDRVCESVISSRHCLVGDEDVDHRVQVVEEGQEVEGHLAPTLVHGEVERIAVHDRRRIVQARLRHSAWAFRVAPHVISKLDTTNSKRIITYNL